MDVTHNDNWWWLSFCDPDLPTGKSFLGAAIVQADDPIQEAWRLKINPGGEVLVEELADFLTSHHEGMRNRLLSRVEAKAAQAVFTAAYQRAFNPAFKPH